MNISIEIERNHVTVAAFLAYVKKQCAQKGIAFDIDRHMFENPTQNLYRSYHVKDGIKYCTTGYKRRNGQTGGVETVFSNSEYEADTGAEAETSREFPLDWQTYIRMFDGSVYNEICEFNFDDEKHGRGYFFVLSKDAPLSNGVGA
jgi:uncharacterized protein YegP (UPF0339 family)